MRTKTRFLLLLLLSSRLALAADPIYRVRLAATPAFEIVAGSTDTLAFYGFDSAKPPTGRKVVAADYAVGIRIRTDDPAMALQVILNQVARQTGLRLHSHVNSNLAEISPSMLLQGFSDTAVITMLLTPTEKSVFILTCAYVLDERPPGSIDGTPTALAQMDEMSRRVTADSVATTLPATIAATELKPEDYFRGAQSLSLSDAAGNTQTPVLVLLLKKGDHYSVGVYQNVAGTWSMLDQPIAVSGTGTPHSSVKADLHATRSSVRAIKLDGTGGIDLFVESGHVVQQAFSN